MKQYLLKTSAKSRMSSVISAWLLEGRSYSLSGSAPGDDGGLGVEGGVAGVEGVCDCNRFRTNGFLTTRPWSHTSVFSLSL